MWAASPPPLAAHAAVSPFSPLVVISQHRHPVSPPLSPGDASPSTSPDRASYGLHHT
jgi:hypothetical protein